MNGVLRLTQEYFAYTTEISIIVEDTPMEHDAKWDARIRSRDPHNLPLAKDTFRAERDKSELIVTEIAECLLPVQCALSRGS